MNYTDIISRIDEIIETLDYVEETNLELELSKLDMLLEEKTSKIDAYAIAYQRLQAEIEGEKAKLKHLQEKYKTRIAYLTRSFENLKQRLVSYYESGTMPKKVKGNKHSITFKEYQKVQVNCDSDKLPEDCKRVKIEPNLTALKKAIKADLISPDLAEITSNISPLIK